MTTENIIQDNQNQTPPVIPDPAAQVPPVPQTVPLSRLNEEITKRQELEIQMQLLRDQQLRMMAQQTAPPVMPQQQTEDNDDEFNQLFNISPAQAVESKLKKKEQEYMKRIQEESDKRFWINQNKIVAMTKYPDLRNPSSDFFKRVSFYMQTHPDKYNDPEGILDACARVHAELPPATSAAAQQVNQQIVQQVASAASQVAPASNIPQSESLELDNEAKTLAVKLGIDPKKMAERLKNLQTGQGEYAPAEGKTGKALLK